MEDDLLQFSATAQSICVRLLKAHNTLNIDAVNLRLELINCGVISEQDTYEMVVSNKPLKSAIVQYLGLALEKDPNSSKYGKEFGISDFDVYFYCNTMAKASEFMKEFVPDKPYHEVSNILNSLVAKKKNIQNYLYRVRDMILMNMELPETPEQFEIKKSSSEKKKKEEETKKTEEEIVSVVTKNLFPPATKKNTAAVPSEEEDEISEITGPNNIFSDDEKTVVALPEDEGETNKKPLGDDEVVDDDSCEEEEDDDEEDEEHEEEEQMKRKSSSGGGKFAYLSTVEDDQQLYETMECDVLSLIDYLSYRLPKTFGKRVFEPCYGNGAIAKVLEKHGYKVTVARDLYTLEEKIDFLDYTLLPPKDAYDIIITNTPFKNKCKFFDALQCTGKPFCAIFPDELIGHLADKYRNGYKVLVPKSKMKFLHNGRIAAYAGYCYWFLGNFDESDLSTPNGLYTIEYLK